MEAGDGEPDEAIGVLVSAVPIVDRLTGVPAFEDTAEVVRVRAIDEAELELPVEDFPPLSEGCTGFGVALRNAWVFVGVVAAGLTLAFGVAAARLFRDGVVGVVGAVEEALLIVLPVGEGDTAVARSDAALVADLILAAVALPVARPVDVVFIPLLADAGVGPWPGADERMLGVGVCPSPLTVDVAEPTLFCDRSEDAEGTRFTLRCAS